MLLTPDGSHVIPLTDIQPPGRGPIAGSTGRLSWSPRDGLKFTAKWKVPLGTRITDVTPETKSAGVGRSSPILNVIGRVKPATRRRVKTSQLR